MGAMKILLVAGDPTLVRSLLPALAQAGHRVEVVTSRMTSLQIWRQHHDLVILEASVPSGDGRSTCAILRSGGVVAPILMLSARAEAAERVAGLDGGADDFLSRPFDLEEFLARVRALGRRRHAARRTPGSAESPVRPGDSR